MKKTFTVILAPIHSEINSKFVQVRARDPCFCQYTCPLLTPMKINKKQGRGKSKQKQSPKVDQGKGKLFLAIERQKCIAIINSTMGRL